MARYRSNKGDFLLRSFERRSEMLDSEASSGAGLLARSFDVGGAGSIEV